MEHNFMSNQSTVSEWARNAEKEILAVPMPTSGKKVWFSRRRDSHRSASSYKSREGKKSKGDNVKQWYVGDASMGKRRYCGGRLNLCAFVCIHLCTITLLLLAILIPVIYLVVVPNNIQALLLSNGSLDGMNLTLSGAKNENNFHADFNFKKVSFLPGTVTLIPPTQLNFGGNAVFQTPFATIALAEIKASINQDSRLGVDGNFTLLSTPSYASLLKIATGSSYILYMKTEWTLQLWGIVWYRNLPLTGHYDLQSDSGKSFFNFVTENFLKENVTSTV